MAFETTSVFDVMAADETTTRVASRRALALAHTRVENQLGAYLRAAVSAEEFDARLASVREELDSHVASAVDEVQGGNLNAITSSIIDHYRGTRRWQPRVAADDWEPDAWGAEPVQNPNDPYLEARHGPWSAKWNGGRLMDVYHDEASDPVDSIEAGPYDWQNSGMGGPAWINGEAPHQQGVNQRLQDWAGEYGNDYTRQLPYMSSTNPADQKDTSNDAVTCPECGGSKKTANGAPCPKCAGKGVVRNFGDSVLDHVASVVTADNAIGLSDKAEPTMDTRKWTPQTTQKPVDDSKYHPTRQQDPLEPIIQGNRDQPGHDLKDIGERSTERVELPSDDTNAGFSTDSKPGPAPHTKTFPGTGQTTPVTSEGQS